MVYVEQDGKAGYRWRLRVAVSRETVVYRGSVSLIRSDHSSQGRPSAFSSDAEALLPD